MDRLKAVISPKNGGKKKNPTKLIKFPMEAKYLKGLSCLDRPSRCVVVNTKGMIYRRNTILKLIPWVCKINMLVPLITRGGSKQTGCNILETSDVQNHLRFIWKSRCPSKKSKGNWSIVKSQTANRILFGRFVFIK